LGGVGEVGKNSTVIEFGEDMVIVDAGVKFPEAELHGVDLVVCDYGYVAERLDSLLGILFTHGHEDHIGGLPYLIMQLDPHDPIPIYGTPLTLGLISVKLKEHGMLGRVIQHAIRDGDRATLGPFDIEPIEDMVRLTVTHDELEPGSSMGRGITEGWPRVLSSLKSLLETGRPLRTWAGK